MSISESIGADLSRAMKERDAVKTGTLRMVKAAFKNQEIEIGGALDDEASVRVLARLCNQRKDSIEQYEKGGRADLAERERAELVIIEAYMPQAPGEDEVRAAITEVLGGLASPSIKDMGQVMKDVLARFKGRPVEGRLVSQWVRQALGG